MAKSGDEAPVPDDGIKPTFTERPVIRQTDDGSTISFECRCVGKPKPAVTWLVFSFILITHKIIRQANPTEMSDLHHLTNCLFIQCK